MDDTISRQAAIQAFCKAVHKNDDTIPCDNQTVSCLWSKTRVCDFAREIYRLPTVQPEPLTDIEQRIFLAAMSREEKVCKKVDDEWEHAFPGVTSNFVRICREIERKVKKALWTN